MVRGSMRGGRGGSMRGGFKKASFSEYFGIGKMSIE